MDQGLPEAKRAKTVSSTYRTAADNDETPATHHRTTSTKTTSNLLIRLSQGCLRHQQTCHSNDESMAQGDGAEAQQCASEMQKLSRLIPLIEASCLNAIHISPAEIQNLALFYISVVQRTYCPYSLLYIFNDGQGAVEGKRKHCLLYLLTIVLFIYIYYICTSTTNNNVSKPETFMSFLFFVCFISESHNTYIFISFSLSIAKSTSTSVSCPPYKCHGARYHSIHGQEA